MVSGAEKCLLNFRAAFKSIIFKVFVFKQGNLVSVEQFPQVTVSLHLDHLSLLR